MICDQRLVEMDDDERVAIVEQPDGSMLDTPVRVACNGGAGRVRSNVEIRTCFRSRKKIQEAATGSSQVCAAETMEARLP